MGQQKRVQQISLFLAEHCNAITNSANVIRCCLSVVCNASVHIGSHTFHIKVANGLNC